MQRLRHFLLELVSPIAVALGLLLCASLALASDAPPPTEGHPLFEQIFAYIGMVASALSVLATVLPRTWAITQLFARFSADLRGILTPDPSDDPDWIKRSKGGGSLIVLAALGPLPVAASACGPVQESVLPVARECAPDKQYFIQGLSDILDGQDAFKVLDRIKVDQGIPFVLCALERFLDRVAVTPETADQRRRARAYLEAHETR